MVPRKEVLEVAGKAWKQAPPMKFSEIGDYRVFRTNKMVLVFPLFPKEEHFDVIAFPEPKHSGDFEKAAKGLFPGGPAERYPGAIGTVRICLQPLSKEAIFEFAQAHFSSNKKPLPRRLATQYGGWREWALEIATRELVGRHGMSITLDKRKFSKEELRHLWRKAGKPTEFQRELRRAVSAAGAECEEDSNFLTILRRKRF